MWDIEDKVGKDGADEIKREINRVESEKSLEIYRLTKQLEELENRKRELTRPRGKKIITMYTTGSKDSNGEQGEDLGLTGDALINFLYALYEVEFEVELDCETGNTKILKVDGIPLDYGKEI